MKTRTKIFLILWIASVISSILVLPYIYNIQGELLKESGVTIQTLIFLAIIQGVVTFGIATFFGLNLADKTGFKLPLLTSFIEHKKIKYSRTLFLSILWGFIAGMIILLMDKFVFQDFILSLINVPKWQGFLACFYGGIAEEIIMRLFLVSLFVFLIMKIFRRKESNSIIIWISIIIVSILFGLGHLPITSSIVSITPFVVLRAIVLNGIGGVIFGWLYWKKGLESAIIAHFTADIVLHVIVAY
ncbi:MAG: CPBP family glutamic-type intramembrane protease [Candidatus Pacearchaeota archaeon]|jgi:membrane protease YdiL (CAAX protease family)